MASNTKGKSPEAKILTIDNKTTQALDLISDIFVNSIFEDIENSNSVHQDQPEGSITLLYRRSEDNEREVCGASWHSDY